MVLYNRKAFLHKWWKKILTNSPLVDEQDRLKIYRGEMEKIPTPAGEDKRFDPSKKQGSYGKVKTISIRYSHSLCTLWKSQPLFVTSFKSKRKGVLCEAAPKGARQEDILFCEDILSSVSRSFAGVIKELPPCLRLPVALFYLVLRALDTIEDEMDLTRFEPYLTDEISDTYDVKIHMLLHFHERLLPNIPLATCNSKGGIVEGDELKLVEEFDRVNRVYNALSAEQARGDRRHYQKNGEGNVRICWPGLGSRNEESH